ncbi:MAG: nucleoside hydrolase, partial [Oscillospiraceae bacterium]|nr:nucleoside hydrolase [Oscillospiraceae bacterium]
AAPFLNNRSTSPEDGMLKSYNELKNITSLTNPNHKIPIYHGSRNYLPDKQTPVESPAADNIIKTALESEGLVYVTAIGAITNVASAIIKCPEIINKIAVIWLGGHALDCHYRREFNMVQDVPAAQVVFDSGVPLVHVPAVGVTSDLTISIPELDYYLNGKNKLCSYLTEIVQGYTNDPYCWSKVIWDIGTIACAALPNSMERVIIPTPIVNNETTYTMDYARHLMIYVRKVHRDMIFRDLFKLLTSV